MEAGALHREQLDKVGTRKKQVELWYCKGGSRSERTYQK